MSDSTSTGCDVHYWAALEGMCGCMTAGVLSTKVSTAALQSGWRNMESSLCNFFTFWQILAPIHLSLSSSSLLFLSFRVK
jgi:hypothetical protein